MSACPSLVDSSSFLSTLLVYLSLASAVSGSAKCLGSCVFEVCSVVTSVALFSLDISSLRSFIRMIFANVYFIDFTKGYSIFLIDSKIESMHI